MQSRNIDNICMSSSCVLYTQWCRCLWIVCLRPVYCVPNVVDVSGLYVIVLCIVYPMLSMSDIDNIGYTRHRTKTYNPETSTTLGTQYTGRRHTIQRHLVCLRSVSCVTNVVDFSGLYVFVLCIVYPMLSMSLDCMSSSCVLCTQCC
jgi:hypothetical protein